MNKTEIKINIDPDEPDPLMVELVRALGITEEFATFGCTSEGKTLPGGFTNESGMILTKDGKIYHYWLDWDPEKIAPDGSKGYYTLGDTEYYLEGKTRVYYFKEIPPGDKLYPKPDDSSFIAAKKRLGLK